MLFIILIMDYVIYGEIAQYLVTGYTFYGLIDGDLKKAAAGLLMLSVVSISMNYLDRISEKTINKKHKTDSLLEKKIKD